MSLRGSILQVITTIDRGGAENAVMTLIDGLLEKKYSVSVVSLKGGQYWQASLESKGVRVFSLGIPRYFSPTSVLKLRSIISEIDPDVVHAHMPPAEVYSRLALSRYKSKRPALVIGKHNDGPFVETSWLGPSQLGIAEILGDWTARGASHVITSSDAVRLGCLRRYPSLSESIITTAHYGIDIKATSAERNAIRQSWNVDEPCTLIGTVARFVPQKSLHTLLRGYALYRKQIPYASKLVLVGRGPLEPELRLEASRLGISSEIIWAGFREDISAVMAALDIFALTSDYEGFGLVLLEAMAAGLPIVATKVSSIPEIVKHGETGFLVEPRNPEAVASALGALADEQTRLRFGQAGRERAQSFPISKMVDKTAAVYEHALSSGFSR